MMDSLDRQVSRGESQSAAPRGRSAGGLELGMTGIAAPGEMTAVLANGLSTSGVRDGFGLGVELGSLGARALSIGALALGLLLVLVITGGGPPV